MDKVNFDVTEVWTMICPACELEQEAPFNSMNPMQPLKVECIECGVIFILTYERD